jgi:hypothetical protein
MKRLLTALVGAAALGVSGCGGGGTAITPPPPSGNFGLGSVNGTYAFTTSGEVCAGCTFAATPMARVGSFIADGMGHITGGMEDVNTGGTPNNPSSITGGSYTVNPDGRGTLTFTFQNGNSIDFGIVLTSTADGLLIDETRTGTQASTGSGNFVLQQSTPFALSELTGNYVFDFAGFDGAQPNPNPESFIGNFTADGTGGTIPAGLFDDNDGGQLISGGMNPGTISQDPSQPAAFTNFGRGIATVAGQNFVFYIVNSGRIRFLSTNNGMLSGDAVLQSTPPAGFSGDFAFLVGGSDSNSSGLTRVGRFTASGNTLGKMLVDVNDAANEVQLNNLSNGTIASYDSNTGRGRLSFQDSTGQIYAFVFFLSSPNGGVIQDVSPSNTAGFARVVADGSILGQSGSPFTSSNITGPYAMNWSGIVTSNNNQDEEDLLSRVSVASLALNGTSDIFQFTTTNLTPQFDIGTNGQISFNGGNGTGDDGKRVNMTVNLSNTSPIHMVVYLVSPQLAFFANSDNNGAPRIVAGILKAQQ